MSRIGRKPIAVPAGAKVSVEGRTVKTQGPKGSLSWELPKGISLKIEQSGSQGTVTVTREGDSQGVRAFHGLTRALVANMVVGVVTGYEKRLELQGVGYRAQMKGKQISLQVGFAHSVEVDALPGVEVAVPAPEKIVVRGIDKQAVGQMAARIGGVRPPEPYKGKGIRYEGEVVRRKAGKAFVSSGA